MISSPWFIFKGDHHLGPFTTTEIANKLKKGELSSEELLWREGEATWRKVKSFEEFVPRPVAAKVEVKKAEVKKIELPPLPPIEEDIAPPPFEIEEEAPPVVDIEEVVPEFYQEEVVKKSDKDNIATKDELEAFFIKEKAKAVESRPVEKKKIGRPKFSFKLSLSVFAILLCLSGVGIYFGLKTFSEKPEHYDGLSRGQVERLERFSAKTVAKGKMEVSFDLTEGQTSLWVTINPPITTNATLSLTSLNGQVLSGVNEVYNGEVLALSEARIVKGRGKFDIFRIVKGERLFEGRYSVNLALINRPMIDTDSNWTEILKWSGDTGLTQIKTQFLWGRVSGDEFDKKLENAKKAMASSQNLKMNDRLEKYKTLKELSMNLFTLYKETVESINRPQDIQKFEAEYAKQIGPLLQGIIIEAIKMSNDLRSEDAKASELYIKLSEHGKLIGEMASDMVTMTKSSKNFVATGRNRLISLFESRSKELSERSQQAVEFLERN